MKAVRRIGLVLVVLTAVLGLGAMTAAAQGPVASLTTINAPYIDNQSHTIPANSSVWYRFDYAINPDTGVRPITTITLVNGDVSGVTFDVWTASGAADTADNMPVGKANTYNVGTDSGVMTSSNLDWVGAFGASGAYYVRVMNTNSSDTAAQLTIEGDGVGLAPVAVTGPSASTQPGPNTDDPTKAVALDGKQQTIPANSAQWYTFNYTVDPDTGVRPNVQITLANGAMSGLKFEIYSPEILNNWWENTPVGTGTTTTMASESGMMQSPDLVWVGSFGGSGPYYVRVVNDTGSAMPAVLTIQ